MPDGNPYKTLGIAPGAPPSEIRRAYRRIAFAVHPDTGEHSDPERFRAANEAYETLIDPERRRYWDVRFGGGRTSPAQEGRDAVAEFDDRADRRGFGRRFAVEAILGFDEARYGCEASIDLPVIASCNRCGGASGPWLACPDCSGSGVIETMRRVILQIPPRSSDGEIYEVGMGDIVLELAITVR